ncbi:MAG: SDR family oxidoreductase [Myxococcales bacterium]|nr:SDR family oxidoreductase [Myxococcales bacterium]
MTETVFITGATGFLGSYVLDLYLRETSAKLLVLTRAKSRADGLEKLWKALQLHMSAETFWELEGRMEIVSGDLASPKLGMDDATWHRVATESESILHIAASLNRKSEKACLNHNLKGTLSMIQLARAAQDHHGLRRFANVSTTAIAGKRWSETLREDEALDWDRSDYDPYARTKKFCEHMVAELLPDVPTTIFRPSTVMGDSRHPRTTQFEMVQAFNTVFDLPAFPIRPTARVDIVNADWVGRAMFEIFRDDAKAKHGIYHLSAGEASPVAKDIAQAMAGAGRRPPVMVPGLLGATQTAFDLIAGLPQRNALTYIGSLFKVFLPYITFDTVFVNERASEAIGRKPVSFLEYGPAFAEWCREQKYRFDYAPLPERPARVNVGGEISA